MEVTVDNKQAEDSTKEARLIEGGDGSDTPSDLKDDGSPKISQGARIKGNGNQKKPYTCFYCEFSVDKFKYIKSHIKRFHILEETGSRNQCPPQDQIELNPTSVPSHSEKEGVPSLATTLISEPASYSAPSQTKKFDMDLCPYCDFSDKVEKKLRHHILSKHSKELDKIIIYNNEYDKKEPKSMPKKSIKSRETVENINLPLSFNISNEKFTTVAQRKKNYKPTIKKEISDKNQNDIVPFTIQPDVETISLNNFSSAVDRNEFRCAHCSYNTNEAWELMIHISQSHPEEVSLQHSAFTNQAGIHEDSDELVCSGAEVPDKTFYCIHCKYSTHRAQLLNRHILSRHSDRKPHRCHECDYATKRMEHLNRHILSKHSAERPFPCQYCDYRASRDDHLRNHVLSKHSGEQLLRCVHCGYSALSTEHLNVHVLTKHSDRKPFMCQECDFAGSQEEDLTEHMVNAHSRTEPYACELCPYTTGRLENLNRHVLAVHSAERPFRCKLCDYSSARSEHLNYHLMSKHRDERPHVCSECDYRATRLSHLTRHIQSKHAGVKPFLCPQCDYRAARMEHLHRHILARHSASHPGGPFSCYSCDFTTESRELFDHHILSTHVEGSTVLYSQFCDIPIKAELIDDEMSEQSEPNDDDQGS